MKKTNLRTIALWIVVTEAIGALSGWQTREGRKVYSETVIQAPLSPPSIVFPIVWTILFALMGIGAARIYQAPASDVRTRSLFLFWLQLAFNFFWSIIFFNLQNFGFAFVWIIALWVLILFMILSFNKIDKLAARLQIPYLIWVTFAAYLNFSVWMLNR